MSAEEKIILKSKIILKGNIRVLTGLHIGGNKETIEIGGIDNPIIKTVNGVPYIPGSSLKGKIRSLLENKKGKICDCGECDVCKLFGPHESKNIQEPSRLIFRDAFPTQEEVITEEKTENTIDRKTGLAKNPRRTERVPEGTLFNFEIIFNQYFEDDKGLFQKLLTGMKLLEDDYLGGSGTRGYGKIRFENLKVVKKTIEDYEKGTAGNEENFNFEQNEMNESINKLFN